MPRRFVEEDRDDDDDGEWPLDDADDDDDSTVPCPYCRRPIPEDTPRCPYCEQYISDEDAPAERKPWWIVIGALACLYIVYRWVIG
ncbi:MAG TPA: hypothetical protein VGH74_09125 [Planctomycetaceae bacterium]